MWQPAVAPEQRAIVDAIDALCARHVRPEQVAAWDREQRYPAEAMRALADAGWAALAVPREYGGGGGSARDLATVHETLARHGLAVAQAYFSMWVLGADVIARLGTAEQREHWLSRIIAGQAAVAFALTEPESGSDAAALRTTARRDHDEYVVNGQKVFTTGAAVADTIVVAVRTSTNGHRQAGISLMFVDPRAPGVTIRPLTKLGLKAIDLCEVFLSDVRVPADDVLGPLDGAWAAMKPGLARERLFLAAICVGAMRDLVASATGYATTRHAFGRPIGGHQMVAERLVRMRVNLDASAALVDAAARAIDDQTEDAPVAAAVAKLYASEAYVSASREAVQIFGGYGYTDEYPVARHYRDSKYLEIGGGTSQIQTIVIGRSMGLPL